MHEFAYRNNELYCESTKVDEIAAKFGTPVYIYSYKTLIDHYQKIKRAFKSVAPLICFSVKANSNLAVLKTLARHGAGMDVVSGGELYKVLKAGVNPKKIVYAGVGKSRNEIAEAIKAHILFFNVESVAELGLIEQIASGVDKKVNISLRINPDIDPRTHIFITTGRLTNKFGLDMQTAEEVFSHARLFPHLRLIGIHIHIGSQITDSLPFIRAIEKTLTLIKRLRRKKIPLKFFNIGGGLGIIYRNEKPQSAYQFACAILPLLKKTGLKVILEPGRFIAGNSGILATRVVYMKRMANKNFAIVDAGMNDLIRPSLYGAYHEIVPIVRATDDKQRKIKYDIVGPICESSDFFAKDRRLPEMKEGDLLAIMGAGAYGFTMSSNYNSRPRAAEVLVIDDKCYGVRKREEYRDLIKGEFIPGVLKY